MLHTVNKQLAVRPFKTTSVKMTATRAMPGIENLKTLTALEVVFPSDDREYAKGDVVLVNGSVSANQWARDVFEEDGEKFILIPYAVILGVRRVNEYAYSVATSSTAAK